MDERKDKNNSLNSAFLIGLLCCYALFLESLLPISVWTIILSLCDIPGCTFSVQMGLRI